MQYNIEQYKTIQDNARQYNTNQHNIITYKAKHGKPLQNMTIQFKTILNNTRQ